MPVTLQLWFNWLLLLLVVTIMHQARSLETHCHNRSHISVARFRSNVLVLPVHCCTEFSE